MIKILFLIHDLGQGGAEKVLVNLVNNMDRSKFDISVTALFGGGINEQFLQPYIHYHVIWSNEFPGNSKVMKLLSPMQLHNICVKEHYDIEVSYLEGPSARIISGCTNKDTKLVCWVHSTIETYSQLTSSFRNIAEAEKSYQRFDYVAFVAKETQNKFKQLVKLRKNNGVLYNTIESRVIHEKAGESVVEIIKNDAIHLVTVGSLKRVKGYDRLLRIIKKLKQEQYSIHLYILGDGPLKSELQKYISDNSLQDTVSLLGYVINPYKYVANCDLFVCSSYSEGFSTAVTEALIVGTAVCTTDVSGMREMLGENNDFGIVTLNDEESLYCGIKKLLDDRKLLAFYSQRALERGKIFSTGETVRATERMLFGLI